MAPGSPRWYIRWPGEAFRRATAEDDERVLVPGNHFEMIVARSAREAQRLFAEYKRRGMLRD